MPETVEAGTVQTRSAIRHLRVVNLLEGASYALLVMVAMPLKYLAGEPAMVRVVGMLHGLLFVAFVLVLARAALAGRWHLGRAMTAFLWTLVPVVGAIHLDRRLRRES